MNKAVNDLISRTAALEIISAAKGITWSESAKILCNKIYSQIKDIPAVNEEPRVMTPIEAYTADFVYVEFDGVITPALRTSNEREGHRESYFATQQLGGEWMRWDDYGITWRCWTFRPTDEQRQAVKWE